MEPTEPEKSFIDCLTTGKLHDLIPSLSADQHITKNLVDGWGIRHDISADSIRNVLRGKYLIRGEVDARGIRIRGARIVGRLDLADIESRIPVELTNCYIPDGIHGTACHLARLNLSHSIIESSAADTTTLSLDDARIDGQLKLTGTTLINHDGPALNADRLSVGSDMLLDNSFVAEGTGDRGVICLTGAKIDGQLNFNNATLTSDDGPALSADLLSVGSDMSLDNSFVAKGTSKRGVVRLTGAKIDGQLNLNNATLTSDDGPALSADRLSVGSSVFLDGNFNATGNGDKGTIRLLGAKIEGQLSLNNATLINHAGPALIANRIFVASDMFLDGTFKATGNSNEGTIRLQHAAIGLLHIPANVINISTCEDTLAVPKVSSSNKLNGKIPDISSSPKWAIDGLLYTGYPTKNPEDWLNLLQKGTVEYAAQPYQQLAKNARAAGHDGEERRILIAQRNDQLKRGNPGRRAKSWGYFTKYAVGYGYLSWLPLAWLAFIFLLTLATTVWWLPGGLATVDSFSKLGFSPQCSISERFQVAIDTVIPLVSTGVEHICKVNPRTQSGNQLAFILFFFKAVSWALVTLFIAGFTGIIRKN